MNRLFAIANISKNPILPIEERIFINSILLLRFASNLQLVSLIIYETYTIPSLL